MNHEGHEGSQRALLEQEPTALAVSHDVVTAAMKAHSALGPGLLESAYEACLAHELRNLGHECETQVALPVEYDGIRLDVGYRLDMLVDDLVIVELKSVDAMHPIFSRAINFLPQTQQQKFRPANKL